MNKKSIISTVFVLGLVAAIFFSPARAALQGFFLTVFRRPGLALSEGGRKTGSFFGGIWQISHLKEQNSVLSEKIVGLEVDKSKILELEHENALLKNELGYAEQNKNISLLPARIVFRDPTSFFEHIKVDKGKNDGVVVGQAVISGGALVGQVREVYDNEAGITLVTSKDSIILAMLQNSRASGVLRGGISGLVLEDVAQDVEFSKNEFVVTSGLDESLPAGILIGRASGVQTSGSDLFKNITIEPTVDLSKIELIFIVK